MASLGVDYVNYSKIIVTIEEKTYKVLESVLL